MRTTIDAAGRIVIPKSLREQAGLAPGVEVHVQLDGSGIHIEAAGGGELEPRGRFLTIPASGQPVEDDTVDRLRRDAQR
jgi:AbrB family looped-hinge helix DNA binding protein